jgi:hypothetical protein
VGEQGVSWKKLGASLSVCAVVGALVATPASAAVPLDNDHPQPPAARVERGPAVADFEGAKIDLAGDWGQAHACLVWRQGGVLECFRTAAAMEQRARQLAPRRDPGPAGATGSTGSAGSPGAVTAFSAFSCSSPLNLYDDINYGGRQVSFWDRGYWQNLGDYGFDNRVSSFITGGCYVHLAENRDGAGWWFPGDTSPYHGEAFVSWAWNDRISSIYLE